MFASCPSALSALLCSSQWAHYRPPPSLRLSPLNSPRATNTWTVFVTPLEWGCSPPLPVCPSALSHGGRQSKGQQRFSFSVPHPSNLSQTQKAWSSSLQVQSVKRFFSSNYYFLMWVFLGMEVCGVLSIQCLKVWNLQVQNVDFCFIFIINIFLFIYIFVWFGGQNGGWPRLWKVACYGPWVPKCL